MVGGCCYQCYYLVCVIVPGEALGVESGVSAGGGDHPHCSVKPCSDHTTCENCTLSACMWCSSGPPHCVESNSYVASFPYGQCREWTTLTSKCPGPSIVMLCRPSVCRLSVTYALWLNGQCREWTTLTSKCPGPSTVMLCRPSVCLSSICNICTVVKPTVPRVDNSHLQVSR